MNKYGVQVSGPGGVSSRPKLSRPQLLCQLKSKVEVSTLTSDLEPFSSLPWASQLPLKQLTSDLGPYRSCAVVSSAGSLRSSGLGKEIGDELYLTCSFCFLASCLTFASSSHIYRFSRCCAALQRRADIWLRG